MPLFQSKVLNDNLDRQDPKAVEKTHKIYCSYIHRAKAQPKTSCGKEENEFNNLTLIHI